MASPDVTSSYSYSSSYEESYRPHIEEKPAVYNDAKAWFEEIERNPNSNAQFKSLLRDNVFYVENKVPEKTRRTSNVNSSQVSQLFPTSQSSASLADTTTSSALLISDVERKTLFNNNNNDNK